MITTAFNGSNIGLWQCAFCPFTHLVEASLRTGSKLERVHNLTNLKGYFADITENWEISQK